MPTLLGKLISGVEDDDAVVHLISLPYTTAAAYCMPQILLCCMAPCARSDAQAATVRAAVVAQGVVPTAVKAVSTVSDGPRRSRK